MISSQWVILHLTVLIFISWGHSFVLPIFFCGNHLGKMLHWSFSKHHDSIGWLHFSFVLKWAFSSLIWNASWNFRSFSSYFFLYAMHLVDKINSKNLSTFWVFWMKSTLELCTITSKCTFLFYYSYPIFFHLISYTTVTNTILSHLLWALQPVVDAFDPRLLVAPAISHPIDFTTAKVNVS